jgi:hypothetical protein
VAEDKKEKELEEEKIFQLGEKIPKTRQQAFEEELER